MDGPQRVATGLHLHPKCPNTETQMTFKTTAAKDPGAITHISLLPRQGHEARGLGVGWGGTVTLTRKSQSWWGAVGHHYQSTETRSHKTKISTLPLNIKNNTKQGQGLCDLNKQEVHSRACQAAIHMLSRGGPSCSRPWRNTDSESRKSTVNLAKATKSQLKPYSAIYQAPCTSLSLSFSTGAQRWEESLLTEVFRGIGRPGGLSTWLGLHTYKLEGWL